MGRPKINNNDANKRMKHNITMRGGEWLDLTNKAEEAKLSISAYIVQKCKLKNLPVPKNDPPKESG